MRVSNILDYSFNCALCDLETKNDAIFFENMPYILGVTKQSSEQDLTVSFHISSCPNCGLVQHNHPISTEMYSEIHSHAVGEIWKQHFDALTLFVNSTKLFSDRILEIGPSSSPIARSISNELSKKDINITYVDVMELPPFELCVNETYHSGYFPHKNLKNNKFDLIIASHVLEHAPKIHHFFENMVSNLSDQGAIYISIPNFKLWVKEKYWNAFSLEHTCYPMEMQISWLAWQFGLEFEILKFKNHSIFIRFSKGKPRPLVKDVHWFHSHGFNWSEFINERISYIENCIKALSVLRPVYLTGASHISQYALNMSGLLSKNCVGVFDNAETKYHHRLYGTQVDVFPFTDIPKLGNIAIVVNNSPYKREIINQIKFLDKEKNIIII